MSGSPLPALDPALLAELETTARRRCVDPSQVIAQALRAWLRPDGLCESVFQNAPLTGLMEGVYRANTTLTDLRRHGDFGLGTFNDLDGEMVLLDGDFFQLRADGKAYQPPPETHTPFATVTQFTPFVRETIPGPLDHAKLMEVLAQLLPSENSLYALRIDGDFDHVRVRSVPPQPEGRPLVEVAREQPVFDREQVKGTLAGFWYPHFLEGVNVPGYHLHFLADDRTWGGHLLACGAREVTIAIQHVPRLTMELPITLDFMTGRFRSDLGAEIAEAER
ncbi:acetolactate decarboxylase [Rhodospirillum sp. A1_3_36]|uniref:acetolactate decarboxylase n=1 Tax=Rhodospirillum sp. A1_3_36 TaxID=3391666 RepID=UPI0039A67965